MSDTFWGLLFGVIALIVKDWLDQRRSERLQKQNRALAVDLHANTVETITNRKAVEEFDSASRHVSEEAAGAARVAAKLASTVAIENVVTGQKVLDQTRAIVRSQEIIKEQLNGGPDGLGNRVTKNEARLEGLERGQEAHAKVVEGQGKMIEGVARSLEMLTINFSEFVTQYKRNHAPKEG